MLERVIFYAFVDDYLIDHHKHQILLDQGSQTQNYTRAALRRKMSPWAAD